MVRVSSLFSQILSLVDRRGFQRLVEELGTERYSKGFSSRDHLTAMLWCQLAQSKSLREIQYGLSAAGGRLRHLGLDQAPARSTLAYANRHRSYELFEKVFYKLLESVRTEFSGKNGFRFNNKLLSLDGSTIQLCASVFDWAEYKRTKGGVKLHLALDHEGFLPCFAVITDANASEREVAWNLDLAPGTILAVDRGYLSSALFRKWTEDKVYFVTRTRKNLQLETIEEREVPEGGNVLSDHIVRGASKHLRDQGCPDLRAVTVWDEDQKREIEVLTNIKHLAASTIGAIYKARWEIESFFRTLKQNLRVKTFVGTSANALKIQIWAALIAILLLKYLRKRSQTGWSLSNLVAVLHLNLLTYKDLWQWLKHPFTNSPEGKPRGPTQAFLPLPGLG